MKKKYNRYTVTAALPYANGPIHIGHLAGVYIPADIYVRYLKAQNKEVVFICGSDEHGVPITLTAKKEGKTPQQIADKYHKLIKQSFEKFDICFNIYSRTSSSNHEKTSSDFFKTLYDKGMLVEQTSEQYFDVTSNQFLADRYIKGTCPKCHFEEAFGDQCEKCGSTLNPKDLQNPKSVLSNSKLILKPTKHWFLELNKQTNWLAKWISQKQTEWKPNVYGQCKSWISQGLQPRAVTRDLNWGVPVPLPNASGKVLYVWFDAPIGYVSATKEWAKKHNKNWEPFWQNDDTKLVHFIGKDNIVFHCIIFPTMLKLHGKYILPNNVPANEFLNLENEKISTSRNWAVWLHEYLNDFPNKEDVLRYVLCSNAPETKDNNFTWEDFQAKNNNELVAILGNFINRTIILIHKFFNGKVPELKELSSTDNELIATLKSTPQQISNAIEQFKFREALNSLMDLAREGNRYLTKNEPWKLISTDVDRVKTILNLSVQIVTNLSILASPFLPFTIKKIFKILNINPIYNWDKAGSYALMPVGHQLNPAELLFARIENNEIEEQKNKLKKNKTNRYLKNQESTQQEKLISINEFATTNLKIGTIIDANKVEKTQKLLKLLVDIGGEQRTIVSGIAQNFNPKEIIGKQVVVLTNLEPKKIMGINSFGMLLLTKNKTGNFTFISPDEETYNGEVIN